MSYYYELRCPRAGIINATISVLCKLKAAHYIGRLALAVVSSMAVVPAVSFADSRPFEVIDSVAMTRLVDPDLANRRFVTPSFKFSPDGRHFVVVVQNGNVDTGNNEYSLILFNVEKVIEFVQSASSESFNKQEPSVVFQSSSERHGIRGLKWLSDNETIAFIGTTPDEPDQVYTFNIQTRQLRKLTNSPDPVAAFDFRLGVDKMIYTAWTPPDWNSRNRYGYAVTWQPVHYLAIKDPQDAVKEIKHNILDIPTGVVRATNVPPTLGVRQVWLSPTGRWAVAAPMVQKASAHWWTGYQLLARGGRYKGINEVDGDAFGLPHYWMHRYVLVDMESGTAEPFFDAPSGTAFNGSVLNAVWSSDGESVVLANTFLPLDVSDPAELERRRASTSVVEVHIESRKVTHVADLPAYQDNDRLIPIRVDQLSDRRIVVEQRIAASGQHLPSKVYYKRGQEWVRDNDSPPSHAVLQILVQQDLNTPPEIVAIDRDSGRTKVITDFNPQLRDVTLASVEAIEWVADDGWEWIGGLVRPPGIQSGVRYPLVIQTHGFDPEEFLVDGPDGVPTAFAAQALANKGMIVLQIGDPRRGPGASSVSRDGVNDLHVAGYEAAIDFLDEKGLVDRARVGLIGWSSTGMNVHHAITFSNYSFAAATIADSISMGYLSYINHYGRPYPGMISWERRVGAPFWKDDRQLWLQRSPSFNLHRIATPLRIEHLSLYISDYWDTFAILKRHSRPVELIHIPEANHVLRRPTARYVSQQGNVDWFAFWLKGEEDLDPAKAEQYKRWRKLRRQHEAHLADIEAKRAVGQASP